MMALLLTLALCEGMMSGATLAVEEKDAVPAEEAVVVDIGTCGEKLILVLDADGARTR